MRAIAHPALFTALAVLAQAEDPPPWSGTLQAGYVHAGPGRLDGGGHLRVDESLAEARTYWQPRLGIRVGLGVGGGIHDYAGGAEDVRGEALWLRLPATVMFSEHLGFTSLSSIGRATAGMADADDGRRWQVQAGLLVVRDADLLVAFSVVASSRLGMQPSIFPLISLSWRIGDAWHLTVIDEIDQVSRLVHAWNPRWSASLAVDVRFFEFARDGGEGGAAVLADDRAIIGLEGSWRPLGDDRLAVRPFAGVVVLRRITLRDGDGEDLATDWAAPAPAFGISLRCDL